MARAVEELEREIRSLSSADKERLIDFLMLEVDSPPADLRSLIAQFCLAVDATNESIAATLGHMESLDERLAATARRAREDVLRSDIRWPFPAPPAAN